MSRLSFLVPGAEHAELTLRWRKAPRVTRFMFTDVTHGIAEQTAWLERSRSREDYRHWLVVAKERPIGLVSLQEIDWLGRTSASGFYVGEDDALPLGGFVLPYLYNHAFFELGLITMFAEVVEGNDDVLRLHALHGYAPLPERRRVVKNGRTLLVHRLRLDREAWDEKRALHRYRAEMPWPAAPRCAS